MESRRVEQWKSGFFDWEHPVIPNFRAGRAEEGMTD